MEPYSFPQILQRYLENRCTPGETAWLMQQLASGNLSEAEEQLLKNHLLSGSGRENIQAPRLEERLQRRFEEIKKRISPTPAAVPAPGKQAKMRWQRYAAAAVLAGCIATSYYLFRAQHSRSGTPERIITAKTGEYKNIRLEDGSQVILNGGSTLSLGNDFNKGKREVHLTGEAYFDVKPNDRQPFLIYTGSMDVKVLGTSFNVRAYPDEQSVITSLIKGKVSVTVHNHTAGKPLTETIVLAPMQKLVFIKSSGNTQLSGSGSKSAASVHVDSLVRNSLTNDLSETAWTVHKLSFSNETLEDVANKLEKWYGIDAELDNDTLRKMPYTGSFDSETLEKVMETIQYSIPMLHYSIQGKKLLIW